MPMQPSAAVLVGSSAPMRKHFARILSAANCRIVASAPFVEQLVLPAIGVPILFVIEVGDEPHAAVRQIEAAKHSYPAGRVIVLAERFQLNEVAAAILAGANAYFTRRPCDDILIKSVELVMLGGTRLPSEMLPAVLGDRAEAVAADEGRGSESLTRANPGSPPRLSGRERDILRCLVGGYTNKVIAHKLRLSEQTVKDHVESILHKIGARNRTQAAVWAAQGMRNAWRTRVCH
jgi:DNA-binding NarL/FixJ family response regulator